MWSVLRMRQAHWLIPVISAWGGGEFKASFSYIMSLLRTQR